MQQNSTDDFFGVLPVVHISISIHRYDAGCGAVVVVLLWFPNDTGSYTGTRVSFLRPSIYRNLTSRYPRLLSSGWCGMVSVGGWEQSHRINITKQTTTILKNIIYHRSLLLLLFIIITIIPTQLKHSFELLDR